MVTKRPRTPRPRFKAQRGVTWDGRKLVKPLPADAPPSRACRGMAVADYDSDETGVIVAMTDQLCIYRTAEGHHRAATWHSVCLPHVAPDRRQVVRRKARVDQLLEWVEQDAER